jgi:hypothetical protein
MVFDDAWQVNPKTAMGGNHFASQLFALRGVTKVHGLVLQQMGHCVRVRHCEMIATLLMPSSVGEHGLIRQSNRCAKKSVASERQAASTSGGGVLAAFDFSAQSGSLLRSTSGQEIKRIVP